MKKLYGPIKNQDENWRVRTNEEIYFLMKHEDIGRYVKAHRIRWIGHIVRMDKERTVQRITGWRNYSKWIGRPRLRWEDDIRADLEKMKIQNWSKMAIDREAWKIIVEQAKTHKECSAKRRRMLCREAVTVDSDNHTGHINTLCAYLCRMQI
jgi:hypothetical protein